MINHVSNNEMDVTAVDKVGIYLFAPATSNETTGRVLAGKFDHQITLSVINMSTDYGVIAYLDSETALAIGKQLIKLAVVTGEH